jgi:hypothetical protein
LAVAMMTVVVAIVVAVVIGFVAFEPKKMPLGR